MDTEIENLPIVSFIYKLIIGDKWYIGSSEQSIQTRMKTHYRQALKTPERKLYKEVSEYGGWKNVKCEILTSFPFTTRDELYKQEDRYINLNDLNCLNTNRAILSEEERKNQKKEISKRCKKELYDKRRQDPVWVEQERKRANELYARLKENPEFMEKKRIISLESYHRRQARKKGSKPTEEESVECPTTVLITSQSTPSLM